MNYSVLRQGRDLGTFPLEELRRRREAGELSGNDYVRAETRHHVVKVDRRLTHQGRNTGSCLPP